MTVPVQLGQPARSTRERPLRTRLGGVGALLLALSACHGLGKGPDADWALNGHTTSAQRFSPLDEIDKGNVEKLGLAWSLDLDTDRGQEATPIMVGGVLYIVSAYDVVSAVDARTGKALWTYDPQVRAASAR